MDHRLDEPIHGRAFLNHLEEIGVLRPNSQTKRVIIDAAWNSAIFVYVEELGTGRMLKLEPPDVSGMAVVIMGDE